MKRLRATGIMASVGSWPTNEMQESQAVDKFKRLESIKWLKLKPYTSA